MTEYTKNYKIPYPTIDDPIYNGHTAMKRLAEKVDSTMGSVKAQKGDRGPQGPQGPRGAQGPRGRDAQWIIDTTTSPFSHPQYAQKGSIALTKAGPLIVAKISFTPKINTKYTDITARNIYKVIPEGWRPAAPVGAVLGEDKDYGSESAIIVLDPGGYLTLRHVKKDVAYIGTALWLDPAVLG